MRNRYPGASVVWGVLAVLTVLPPARASANTIAVTSLADGGPGTLREAIANAVPGDTINISVTGTITLTDGPLAIDKDLAIVGPGSHDLAIDAGQLSRVFTIGDAAPATVAVSGVTIRNGAEYVGGGIYNRGTLALTEIVVSGNTGDGFAGGIYNAGGATLTITNGLISGNAAGYHGGGIYTDAASILTIVDSTLSGNSALVGAGISNHEGTVTITRSTLSGNSADDPYGGAGGALYNGGTYSTSSSTVIITNSTVSGNSSSASGGGIYNATGLLTVDNSTIANNSCSCTYGCFGGGGIYNLLGTARISNSTLAGNASLFGGSVISAYGTATLKNSIIAKGASGANCSYNSVDGILSDGHNLSDDGTCVPVLAASSDLNETPAGLSVEGLQDNGGPTATIQLLATSPAVDAVPVDACTNASGPLAFDQREVTRPQGAACDIGAFELPGSLYHAQVLPPVNADGTSVFRGSRRVVPVKFTLTVDGTPTCELPPATIALVRDTETGVAPVNTSDYAAGNGLSFRVDPGSCQYVYALRTNTLGAGTYTATLSIDRVVVGSATFGLR